MPYAITAPRYARVPDGWYPNEDRTAYDLYLSGTFAWRVARGGTAGKWFWVDRHQVVHYYDTAEEAMAVCAALIKMGET
jgi:hypothetical protein